MDTELGSNMLHNQEIGRGGDPEPHLWCCLLSRLVAGRCESRWCRCGCRSDAELNWRCHHHRPPTSLSLATFPPSPPRLKYLSPIDRAAGKVPFAPRARAAAARLALAAWGVVVDEQGKGQGQEQGGSHADGWAPAWSPAHTLYRSRRRPPPPKQGRWVGWFG